MCSFRKCQSEQPMSVKRIAGEGKQIKQRNSILEHSLDCSLKEWEDLPRIWRIVWKFSRILSIWVSSLGIAFPVASIVATKVMLPFLWLNRSGMTPERPSYSASYSVRSWTMDHQVPIKSQQVFTQGLCAWTWMYIFTISFWLDNNIGKKMKTKDFHQSLTTC